MKKEKAPKCSVSNVAPKKAQVVTGKNCGTPEKTADEKEIAAANRRINPDENSMDSRG
jgi:hypothetical protein